MIQATSTYSDFVLIFFIIGYLMIIFEQQTRINKGTSALLMAICCWAWQFADGAIFAENSQELSHHLANVSQVVLFLLGAITIVETISVHGGFALLASFVHVPSKRQCLWVVCLVAFFLSAILDNLTTTIVMIVMLRKILIHTYDRLIFGSAVVIAANAGGAWTPIGDVTTTMLWLGGQLSTVPIIQELFFPSLTCLVVSLCSLTFCVHGRVVPIAPSPKESSPPHSRLVLVLGLLSLVFVPVFKLITNLPPFMGILFSMSFIWLLTDILHHNKQDREHLRVVSIFPKIDLSSIFFFLGILLAVAALQTAGILQEFAHFLDSAIPSKTLIATFIGIVSAVIDNVPLVAASMGMYDLVTYPTDHPFWLLIAYCAGTGGSLLIIGSAAGVAFMSLEKVSFFWYVRRAALPALLGYLAGIGVYLLLQ